MSEHTGHRERLRLRYKREGMNGFAPHEVLELLLTYAIPRVDTNPIAHSLISRFGSLHGVLEASQAELEQVDGIGPNAATLISMLLPVLRMYEQEKMMPRRKLGTYAELAAYCRTLFLGVNCEQFYLLCFDAKLQLIATVRLSSGTPTEVSANPRLIVQELMRHNAVGAVLTHNHPSGSPLPSNEDLELTMEIQAILRGVGIRLIDHIIIAGMQDHSILASHLQEVGGSAPQKAADTPQHVLGTRRRKNGEGER
ncbi:MAG: hypothetical protein IJ662_09375 [Clostridia bacterium]|nr:hypothetical protein [Clostridia bacterium]